MARDLESSRSEVLQGLQEFSLAPSSALAMKSTKSSSSLLIPADPSTADQTVASSSLNLPETEATPQNFLGPAAVPGPDVCFIEPPPSRTGTSSLYLSSPFIILST